MRKKEIIEKYLDSIVRELKERKEQLGNIRGLVCVGAGIDEIWDCVYISSKREEHLWRVIADEHRNENSYTCKVEYIIDGELQYTYDISEELTDRMIER